MSAQSEPSGTNLEKSATGQLPRAADPFEEGLNQRLAAAYFDDAAWLAIGRRQFEQTLPTLEASAKTLATAIGWFWTVYSGSIVVAASLPDALLIPVLVAPVVTLLAAYMLALSAQLPTVGWVDLRSVTEIQTHVVHSARQKRACIYGSAVLLVATVALICTGLLLSLR